MHELINIITAAIAADATTDQKAAGVQACRTIAAALDTEPGRPLVLPGLSPVQPTSRVSIDQVLDLMIAKLSLVAKQGEEHQQPTAAPSTPPASRGLQVPFATTNALQALPRPAPPRPVQPKARPAITPTSTSARKP